MKKTFLVSSLLMLGLGTVAYAQTPPPAAPSDSMSDSSMPNSSMPNNSMPNMDSKHAMHKSCMNIASACESAGFRLSKDVPGKNIWRDCVKPILAGQSIAGVTASPDDIQNCQAQKAAWKSKHHHMDNATPEAPANTTTQPSDQQ